MEAVRRGILTKASFIDIACIFAPHVLEVDGTDRAIGHEHGIKSLVVVGYSRKLKSVYIPVQEQAGVIMSMAEVDFGVVVNLPMIYAVSSEQQYI